MNDIVTLLANKADRISMPPCGQKDYCILLLFYTVLLKTGVCTSANLFSPSIFIYLLAFAGLKRKTCRLQT